MAKADLSIIGVRICEQCGCYRKNDKRNRFCSKKCFDDYQREDRAIYSHCLWCGIEKKNRSRDKYCSRKCYWEARSAGKYPAYWTGKNRDDVAGDKCHLWKGGITEINHKIRSSLEYKLWRKSVFERDNFTCVWCGKRGGNIEADHIKPFAYFPELRFAIDNGRTLCRECHLTTDTHGRRKNV